MEHQADVHPQLRLILPDAGPGCEKNGRRATWPVTTRSGRHQVPVAVLPTAKSLSAFSLKPQSDRLLDGCNVRQMVGMARQEARLCHPTKGHTSTFAVSELSWMNSRRGSTTSPISLVKMSSASSTSLIFTCSSERSLVSRVVSQS